MNPNPDTTSEGATGISEKDARKFVEQLRSAPAEQVIADVFSTLITTAEVKLGRRDARLFIDVCAAMLEHAGPYVSDDFGKQVENALGRLRFGQVSAERQMVNKGESEPNDLSRVPTPPATGAPAEAPTGSRSTEAPSSGLWVPGR